MVTRGAGLFGAGITPANGFWVPTDPSTIASKYTATLQFLLLSSIRLVCLPPTTLNNLTMYDTIFGPNRDEVTGEWRRLHNKELYAVYSPNIIRVIKSRRLRWVGHVARMGEMRNAYRVLVEKPEGRRPLGRRSLDVRIILKRVCKKCDEGMD